MSTLTEKRLFGAMAVIHKEDGSILVIQDESKKEISAAVTPQQWKDRSGTTLNLPAGGRAANTMGLQETLRQTLSREIQEELSPQIYLPRRNKQTGSRLLQQPLPFIAAQHRGDVIHQLGVTSMLYPYELFSKPSKELIEQKVGENAAYWIKLQDLYEALMDDPSGETTFHNYPLRPQLFTAALIWYLHIVETDSKLLQFTITAANREIISSVTHFAQQDGVEIKNGAFNTDGNVAKLNQRDRQFILGN